MLSLKQRVEKVLRDSPSIPKNLPSFIYQQKGEETYILGYKEGWESYKEKIREALNKIDTYSKVLKLINFKPTISSSTIHYDFGFITGWEDYKELLKLSFFG